MFYRAKIQLFRKSVVLISVGITYLPIYYIMCIELKEISAWCFAGFKSSKAPGRNLILRLKLLQLFFCQSSCLHDLRPRNTHYQQVAGYFQTFRQFTFRSTLFLAFNIRAIKTGVVIVNSLNTFIVFFLLLTTQATNICQFSKMIEYLLLRRKRQSFQYFHILQYINPFFKTCLAF